MPFFVHTSTAHAQPVLRIGTEGLYTPFTFHDPSTGQLTGLDIEVAQAVAQAMGRRAEFIEGPFDTLFAGLRAGEFELIANQVAVTPERAGIYNLSIPYIESHGVIITREDDDSIHSTHDLHGKVAAESPVSNWGTLAKELGARIEPTAESSQQFLLLQQGRVDCVILDNLSFLAFTSTVPQSHLKIAVELPDQVPVVFPGRKNDPVIEEVNRALRKLDNDGTLDSIIEKYFSSLANSQSHSLAPTPWQTVRTNLWPMTKAMAKVTIPLTIICFSAGLVIALLTALARLSPSQGISGIARAYVSLVRGTPLLVQLFLIYFALPEFGIRLPPFPAAIVALSLSVGAYASEVIRAAILAVPPGQTEAAYALGCSRVQVLRLIVLPQAIKIAVPPLSNTLISLVKDTSLAATIQVTELFRAAQIAAAPTFRYFELYSTAAIFYWIVCVGLSGLQSRLEHRLQRVSTSS